MGTQPATPFEECPSRRLEVARGPRRAFWGALVLVALACGDDSSTPDSSATDSSTDAPFADAALDAPVSRDGSVDTSELDADPDPSDGEDREIVLDALHAFPAAFGAGQDIPGGRGSEIYAVTNLNDRGEGSYRDAVSRGDRIVIIQVEGRVDLESRLIPSGSDNLTIWGQLAPGRGLTLSGRRNQLRDSHNHIIRHVTFQNGGEDGFGAFGLPQTEGRYTHDSEHGHYLDHLSARYGMDQTLDLSSRLPQERSTVVNCLVAEGVEGHNTGSILGHSGISSEAGQVTWARNMYYNISHRFPNMGGDGGRFEVYNNYISNWQQRLSAVNGPVLVDYFANHADRGNHGLGGAPMNKVHYIPRQWGDSHPLFYSANNIVETVSDTPVADQQDVWAWRKGWPDPCTRGVDCESYDGTEIYGGGSISPSLFTPTQQHNFPVPSDGYWDVREVKDRVTADVGHNRGVNADGSPGFFRDDLDADYVQRSLTDTTERDYRVSSEWNNSPFTATSLYADTDGDYLPDWFEERHEHLDPSDASDRDETQVNWDFGSYTVVNNAGYSNLEMCAAFYANDFEVLLN